MRRTRISSRSPGSATSSRRRWTDTRDQLRPRCCFAARFDVGGRPMQNRFLEMDLEFRRARGNGKGPYVLSVSHAGRWPGWAQPLSAAQRALVILIENGGVDLGIPELADELLSQLPGTSLLPDGLKQKIVEFL